jgi:hypothetical protein
MNTSWIRTLKFVTNAPGRPHRRQDG